MDFIPEYLTKPILVLGCGNVLFGDDGFGPGVVEYLKNNYTIPEYVYVLDAGTSVRGILFDIALGGSKPKKIIIVDAVDVGREAGEIFELPIDEIPENKIDDFSLHELPTSNLLKELVEFCNVEVRIIGVQAKEFTENVHQGISDPLIEVIPRTCELILKLCD